MDKKWQEYVEQTKNAKPRPLLVEALDLVKQKDEALDLGSGALNDSRYLVSEGFKHVTAVDAQPLAIETAENFPKESFSYVISTFESFNFEENKYDLVNAQYALPFNPKESFARVIDSIKKSLKSGGVFVGQFFGERDEWNVPDSKLTFQTKAEAEELLTRLNIIEFKEEEQDSKTAAGVMKHWHVFHFIATK